MNDKTIVGWVRSIRGSKNITFVACTNGKMDFQITIKHDVCQVPENLKIGASFISTGADSTTPRGSYEFVASTFEILGESDDLFPIQPKDHSADFLRSIPEIRTRDRRMNVVLQVRSHAAYYINYFLIKNGFTQYFTPIITDSDAEGAGETFTVSSDWTEKKLTVSGQLHVEAGLMGLGNVYTFGPCFRAEKSATRKHLSEFWMLEPEMVHYNINDSINLSWALIGFVYQGIQESLSEEQKKLIDFKYPEFFNGELPKIMTYSEVCVEFELKYGEDIGSELEKKIVDKHGPTYVTHWPQEMKPFYMKRQDGFALCFDLLYPEVGELIGGSEREEDYETLKSQMEEDKMNTEELQWYLNTRKWGTVPHAGFGLGFERLIMHMTNTEKVHDVIPFPFSYK